MTEIPDDLMKRAREVRGIASIESGGADPKPRHYSGDPFAARRNNDEAVATRLLAAKAKLVTAVLPLRQTLEKIDVTLLGQFLDAKHLSSGPGTATIQGREADLFLTLYGNRESFTKVEGGKTVRVGERHAWRMPVSKGEVGSLLKRTGQRPFRDAIKLTKGYAVLVTAGEIPADIAEQVFDTASFERVTNSVTLYEGESDQSGYSASYGNRYAASVSILRKPANTPEEEGEFGVELLSLTDKYSANEGYEDGGLYDNERSVISIRGSFFDRKPTAEGFTGAFTATEVVLGAFNTLLAEPTNNSSHLVYQAIDAHFRK